MSMNTGGRIEELRRWRADAAEELSTAEAGLAAAQLKLEACRERVRLLDRLLTVEGGSEADTATEARPVATTVASLAPPDELLDACEKVVRSAGRPLHISEMHAALLKDGTPIPGRGTEANLLVRLHRSNGRFVRTGRGTYAPASMGAAEVRPTQRRRVAARSAR